MAVCVCVWGGGGVNCIPVMNISFDTKSDVSIDDVIILIEENRVWCQNFDYSNKKD